MNFLIPVDRLYETERVVAFYHPRIIIMRKLQLNLLLNIEEKLMDHLQRTVLVNIG
jgi:hypothetical protein